MRFRISMRFRRFRRFKKSGRFRMFCHTIIWVFQEVYERSEGLGHGIGQQLPIQELKQINVNI